MASQPQPHMTADEFLVWAEDQPGRHELIRGRVHMVGLRPVRHVEAKGDAYLAMRTVIQKTNLDGEALVGGPLVRGDNTTMFRPDVMVRCGPPIDGDAVEVPDPLIVIEVASPNCGYNDEAVKFIGYFGLPNVRHYLQIDPLKRIVVHHRRDGEEIRSRILGSGALTLDPPGLDLAVEDLFAPIRQPDPHQP